VPQSEAARNGLGAKPNGNRTAISGIRQLNIKSIDFIIISI
jgi:hypothetical protein